MQARKLLLLSNNKGQPIRLFHTPLNDFNIVQNKRTRRIEIKDANSPKNEKNEIYLAKMNLNQNNEKNLVICTIPQIGTLTLLNSIQQTNTDLTAKTFSSVNQSVDQTEVVHFSDSFGNLSLDPQFNNNESSTLPGILKWSTASHGLIVGLLVLVAFLIPKPVKPITEDPHLVTIDLSHLKNEKPMTVLPQKRQNKTIRVVPRTHKTKSLLVQNNSGTQNFSRTHIKSRALLHGQQKRSTHHINANQNNMSHTQFQRLGSLGVVANAIKGTPKGFGSGLRGMNGTSSGGTGKGAGVGTGNGTRGHGHDNGGGYQQALYGKGLIAGQVGSGSGGYGSGWGDGTPGEGGYGNSGKGSGHSGFGNSPFGSGAAKFSYPITEDAVVEGGLDKDQVAQVIQKNIGQITYCYELGLQKENNLKGRVSVDFVIGRSGLVQSIQIASSSLHSASVEKCMQSKIKNWKFPHPVGAVEVQVNYPFLLQRVSQ